MGSTAAVAEGVEADEIEAPGAGVEAADIEAPGARVEAADTEAATSPLPWQLNVWSGTLQLEVVQIIRLEYVPVVSDCTIANMDAAASADKPVKARYVTNEAAVYATQ